MPIAYQEQAQLICPACGADFAASIWLILDAQEQPEAVAALRSDKLNIVVCPHCGNSGPAGAPLLYHDGLARHVLFAPAPGSAEHEWREQARELHAVLVGSIPEEQRRPYLADVDITQDLAGIAHRLRKLERRQGRQGDRETGRQGDRETGSAEDTPATKVAAPGLPVSSASEASAVSGASEQREQAPPLLVAVEAMLAANTPEELDRALVDFPMLLDVSTDATLAQLAEVAVEQRAFEVAESLGRARELLAHTGAAVAAEPTARALAPALAVTTLPEPALQALLQVQSGAELAAVAEIHPLLLRPEADVLLAERVNQALDDGNERLAQALEERREVLAQLRTTLAQAPSADAPTIDEAIEALLIAEGEDAMAEVIDRYPVLLEEVVGQALWQFAAEARANGDEDLARYAVECREMLRRVREELED